MSDWPAPSLLDRLTDNDRAVTRESEAAGQLSSHRMRDYLKRDISNLLATIRLEDITDLSAYPNIRTSVLNYGIGDISGMPEKNVRALELEAMVRDALRAFEPRLSPGSVHVDVIEYKEGDMRGQAKMVIDASWTDGVVREALNLEARIDFSSGDISLQDA